jgi:hypothetical protein
MHEKLMTHQAIGSSLKIVNIDSLFVLCFSMTDDYRMLLDSLFILCSLTMTIV